MSGGGTPAVRVLAVGNGDQEGLVDGLDATDDLSAGVTTLADLDGAIDCVVVPAGGPDVALNRLARLRASQPELPVVVALAGDGPDLSLPDEPAPMAVVPLGKPPDIEALVARVRAVARSPDTYEQRFRAIVEHAPAMIAVLDAAGRYEYVSPSVERVLGYDADDLVGEVAFDWIHDEDRGRVVEKFSQTVQDPDRRPSAEYRYLDADGGWRVLRSWGKNRLDDPDVGGFVVTSLDVTERRERERALERYHTMVDTVADGVYALDEDLRVRTVNEAALELTGYSREEVIGSHMSEFLEDASKAKADRVREALVESDQSVSTIQLPILRKDGSTVPGEIRFSLFDPDADEYTGSAGVIRDISDRQARERELERQNERLEEFASVVSHDLRNPLNVVQGHVELAQSGTEPDFETIEQAADRMEVIVEDLLSLARQGSTVGDTEPVDVTRLARQAWATVDTGDADLVLDDPPEDVPADPERAVELFENLFHNAVEHGTTNPPSQAPEDAVAHGAPDVTVRVGGCEDGFFVADDGPGVPQDVRDRVFEQGFSTAEGGTGFGLAIVESIAEAHGWTIELRGTESGGARFEVTGLEEAAATGD